MIRLGYTNDVDLWQGSSTKPPYQSPHRVLYADENLANNQLKDIQAYLLYVSTLFHWMNKEYFIYPWDRGKKGNKNAKAYSLSESSALSILKSRASDTKVEYYLKVSWNIALKNRKSLSWNSIGRRKKKYNPSWIFERLYVLAKSSIIVDVWQTALYKGEAGMAGSDYQGFDWNGSNNKESEPSIGAKSTKSWVMLRNDYAGLEYASELRGGVYIHELIIHAWRDIVFGYTGTDKPPGWGALKWFIRQAHQHQGHSFSSAGAKHSLADIEGDFLNWYLAFNQKWVDKALKKGAHDSRAIVGVLSRNMKPPLDGLGENWFSYAGLKKRITENKKHQQGQF